MMVKVVFRGYLRDIVKRDEDILSFYGCNEVDVRTVLSKLITLFSSLREEVMVSQGNWNSEFIIMLQKDSDYIQVTLSDKVVDGDTLVVIPQLWEGSIATHIAI